MYDIFDYTFAWFFVSKCIGKSTGPMDPMGYSTLKGHRHDLLTNTETMELLAWRLKPWCLVSHNFEDHYEIPREVFHLPLAKATAAHLQYHAVYAHVKKQAPRFLDFLKKNGKKWGHEVAKLRPHSGRATLITELMGDGLSTALSMKYAKLGLNWAQCNWRIIWGSKWAMMKESLGVVVFLTL